MSVTGTVQWQANSRFADGQLQTMLVAGQAASRTNDGFGRVAAISTGTGAGAIQNNRDGRVV